MTTAKKKAAAKKAPRSKKAAAKKAPRPKKAAAKKAARQEFPALPPNFPVYPLDPSDPLAGQEFTARVNCHPATNRKGKIVTRCDRQRVTVVATAAPSAEHPKRKQVIAAQKGVQVAVSDRALKRAMRVQARQCDTFAEMVMRGAQPPANAYDLCPTLPDAVEPAGGDASFDVSKFNGYKPNHHHGHHAAGDPLGVYLPPRLDAWEAKSFRDGTPSRVFRHPRLGWEFSVFPDRVSGGFRAQILAGAFAFSGHSPSAQGARKMLEEVYAALPGVDAASVNATFQRAMHTHLPKENARGLVGPTALTTTVDGYDRDPRGDFVLRNVYAGWTMRVFRTPTGNWRGQFDKTSDPPMRLLTEYESAYPEQARMDLRDLLRDRNAELFAAARVRKPNRAPKGTAPGHTYVPRQPDEWQGARVIGDDFAGEVRAPMLLGDGAPGHFVGGHLMPRSRAAAGVRRERILRGEIPAPASRGRRAAAPPAQVVDDAPEIVYEPETVYEPELVEYIPPPPPPPPVAYIPPPPPPPPRPVAMLPAPAAYTPPPAIRVAPSAPVLSDRDAALKAAMEEELRALGLLPAKANRHHARAPRYGY
jgi:hypothetical protein